MKNKIADSKIAVIIQVYVNEKYFVVAAAAACIFDWSNTLGVCECAPPNHIESY